MGTFTFRRSTALSTTMRLAMPLLVVVRRTWKRYSNGTSKINMTQIHPPERTPGLFTDVTLATRKMPFQRLLLKAHIRSAKKWGALAEKAPAVSDLIGLCFRRIPKDALEYFRGGAGDEIS